VACLAVARAVVVHPLELQFLCGSLLGASLEFLHLLELVLDVIRHLRQRLVLSAVASFLSHGARTPHEGPWKEHCAPPRRPLEGAPSPPTKEPRGLRRSCLKPEWLHVQITDPADYPTRSTSQNLTVPHSASEYPIIPDYSRLLTQLTTATTVATTISMESMMNN